MTRRRPKASRTRAATALPPIPIWGLLAFADDPAWWWWCAWRDRGAAVRGDPPDASGFTPARTALEEVVSAGLDAVFSYAFGDVAGGLATLPAELQTFIARQPRAAEAQRHDALAQRGYERLGGDLRPGAAGARRAADADPARAGAAPPPPTSESPRATPWWVGELDVVYPATAQQLRDAYHRRVQVTHPDRPGGSDRALRQLNRAYDDALASIGAKR